MPGVSIIDDKFVMVRGLSQRYNNVWVNGSAVPSSEADSRAFSFDIIPSSQLDNMVIVKSPAPEYPSDFTGGYMKAAGTKDAPIVMTSEQPVGQRKPGDWGALVVCGNARNNENEKQIEGGPRTKHGGTNDATQKSSSHSFFLSEGNRQMTEAALLLTDPKNVGQNYAPSAGSPLLTGGSFAGVTSSYLDKNATYIGAFRDATDNWLDGWTNFDPQNTVY